MHEVAIEESPERVERRSIVVDAPAQTVFDVIADPRRHHEFDGSGTVRSSRSSAPARLEAGAKFGMNMKIGVPYRMTNTVVEFTEGESVAWRHLGGHVWRYGVEPVDGGTKITEEFDWRTSRIPALLKLMKAPSGNAEAIEKTLTRLADLVERTAE
jgi:uncharacterized protein YndB with AHSA1/START domain